MVMERLSIVILVSINLEKKSWINQLARIKNILSYIH